MTYTHKIVIVGGGFGGVKAAQELCKKNLGASIKMIDPKSYMEYHAAMYRMVTGRSPMEVCLSYKDLLSRDAEHVKDAIASIDTEKKQVIGISGSRYSYDTLIMAVGSSPAFFGIEGIEKHAQTMQNACSAEALKVHLQELVAMAEHTKPEDKASLLRVAVVGAGATGVELAGELGWYLRMIAGNVGVDKSLVTVDLIEAAPRVLMAFPEKVSGKVEARLRSLGVNLFLNRSVKSQNDGELVLADMNLKTKTVVWTAGVKANALISQIKDVELDKRGRAVVDAQLKLTKNKDIFAIGDIASTKHAGMAQTALHDAKFVANVIEALLKGKSLPVYEPKQPSYAVPVGPKWCAFVHGNFSASGRMGWILRRTLDLAVFLMLLPFGKAFAAFSSIRQTEEFTKECPIYPKVHPGEKK